MNPAIPLIAIVITMATIGCSSAQFNQLNATITRSQDGAAIQLATSATIAQVALIHMAATLSQAAGQDLGDDDVPPLLGTSGPEAEFAYELDNRAGVGKVTRTHDGKRTVDLSFTFQSERGNAGMAYAITGTAGHFEGYQMFFPRLVFLFSAVLGDNLQPRKHESGRYLFDVDIAAVGSLGTNGIEKVRLSRINFGLVYPLTEGESEVGEIVAMIQDGTTFDGVVLLTNKDLKIQGSIKDPSGTPLYDLKPGPSGEMNLSKLETSSSPAPTSGTP